MKKLLLFSLATLAASAMAMEPLTQEQLDNFRICVTNNVEGEFTESFACTLEYADASNPTVLNIQNFNNTGLPLRVNVDWAAETISIAPYAFNSDFNYDDYSMVFEMVVNSEAAEMANPTLPEFEASRVTGTISENKITIEDWNIVKVDQYFSSITKKYAESLNSEINVPNATIEWTLLEWDDEWDNLIPSYEMEYPIYVNAEEEKISVYNWNDMSSCVRLYKEVNEEGTIRFFTDPNDVVCKTRTYTFGIYPLPGYTWDDVMDNMEAVPLVSAAVTNPHEIEFGAWAIFDMLYYEERSFGNNAKLILDMNILDFYTGIENTGYNEVVGTEYFDLQGFKADANQKGMLIKVETKADGTLRSSKVIR